MNSKKITKFMRWLLLKVRIREASRHIYIKELEVFSSTIDSEIGLYRKIRALSLSFWYASGVFTLLVVLYFIILGPYFFTISFSPVYIIFSVFFQYLAIGLGGYIGFYLPFQPYFILKFSKKKGKELADLLETYSAYNFIITIVALLILSIFLVFSVYVTHMFYHSPNYVWLFMFNAGFLILLFIIYMMGGLMNAMLAYYNLRKWYKGKPTWFDELKARIEMSEEKHEKDNLDVGER
jgi:hypothetical protein